MNPADYDAAEKPNAERREQRYNNNVTVPMEEEDSSAGRHDRSARRISLKGITLHILQLLSLVCVAAACNGAFAKLITKDYSIYVDLSAFWLCANDGCVPHSIASNLCSRFRANVGIVYVSALGLCFFNLINLAIVTLILLKRDYPSKGVVMFNMFCCITLSAMATKFSSGTVSARLCYGKSLASLGFTYGVSVVLFSLTFLASIFSATIFVFLF
uniref:Uncharacterized protein TCIL3000_11_8150 n=1 Tax=Trypanosoma congolense (strain IL3000) TaxID=1068625 RepID=G0V144_TRYCI|nr:unnamed protein product [Trypanosoma congolense IL3000]